MNDMIRILMIVITTSLFVPQYTYSQNNKSDEIFANLYEQEKWDEMIEYSNRILSADSLNINAYKFLSEAYRQKKDYGSAINSLSKILVITYKGEGGKYTAEEMKSFLDTQIVLGNLLYRNKEYQRAVDMLEQTLEVEYLELIDNSKLFIYCNLSASYYKLDDNKKANHYADLAIQINEERAINILRELIGNENSY